MFASKHDKSAGASACVRACVRVCAQKECTSGVIRPGSIALPRLKL